MSRVLRRVFVDIGKSTSKNSFSVMQFNVLANVFATPDFFPTVDLPHLSWAHRSKLLQQELIQYSPDIFCLQEVDQLDFIIEVLRENADYDFLFNPTHHKIIPDDAIFLPSKTLDGMAIFWKRGKFSLEKSEVVSYGRSSRKAIMANFSSSTLQKRLCIVNVHLKGLSGHKRIRRNQANQILRALSEFTHDDPNVDKIIAGDFNDVPQSSACALMRQNEFVSAYAGYEGGEPHTMHTIRKTKAIRRTFDYIWYSNNLEPVRLLEMPERNTDITLPSADYPSDHLSLCAHFRGKSV